MAVVSNQEGEYVRLMVQIAEGAAESRVKSASLREARKIYDDRFSGGPLKQKVKRGCIEVIAKDIYDTEMRKITSRAERDARAEYRSNPEIGKKQRRTRRIGRIPSDRFIGSRR